VRFDHGMMPHRRINLLCASAHLLSDLPTNSAYIAQGESGMTTQTHNSDKTGPEHEHHPMISAALVAFPVMILVSLVGSLFGMA
jgi:hypothetical protein